MKNTLFVIASVAATAYARSLQKRNSFDEDLLKQDDNCFWQCKEE